MKTEPSKPFSNGTEDMIFNEHFCCDCKKYKVDDDGMPLPDNCGIEEAISRALFDETEWPANDIVTILNDDGTVKYWHVCTKYDSGIERDMKLYHAMFEGVRK